MWLHKVWDKDLHQFYREIGLIKQEKEPPIDFGQAINDSMDILSSFVPE